jgi:hypothetical protein
MKLYISQNVFYIFTQGQRQQRYDGRQERQIDKEHSTNKVTKKFALELGYDMTLLVVGRFSVTPSHRTPHDVFA